ncbi:tail completion protein gp17 [Marinovum algicola]|uniref:tail completion protein gp17 n=1 Tax=Marinovum algicola TaxID=42444 RepID=UPI0024BB1085|nr:DUF3168 domain-containing protein [Marinovum algicola]
MRAEIITLLQASVSFPVTWGTLGDDDGLPRAALFRVSGIRDMHLEGTGLMQSRVQIDCYGRTASQAGGAADDIREALEGYQGGTIQGAFLEAVRDTNDRDAELLQRVSLTFSITHRD